MVQFCYREKEVVRSTALKLQRLGSNIVEKWREWLWLRNEVVEKAVRQTLRGSLMRVVAGLQWEASKDQGEHRLLASLIDLSYWMQMEGVQVLPPFVYTANIFSVTLFKMRALLPNAKTGTLRIPVCVLEKLDQYSGCVTTPVWSYMPG